jgi:hypothetical protein
MPPKYFSCTVGLAKWLQKHYCINCQFPVGKFHGFGPMPFWFVCCTVSNSCYCLHLPYLFSKGWCFFNYVIPIFCKVGTMGLSLFIRGWRQNNVPFAIYAIYSVARSHGEKKQSTAHESLLLQIEADDQVSALSKFTQPANLSWS